GKKKVKKQRTAKMTPKPGGRNGKRRASTKAFVDAPSPARGPQTKCSLDAVSGRFSFSTKVVPAPLAWQSEMEGHQTGPDFENVRLFASIGPVSTLRHALLPRSLHRAAWPAQAAPDCVRDGGANSDGDCADDDVFQDLAFTVPRLPAPKPVQIAPIAVSGTPEPTTVAKQASKEGLSSDGVPGGLAAGCGAACLNLPPPGASGTASGLALTTGDTLHVEPPEDGAAAVLSHSPASCDDMQTWDDAAIGSEATAATGATTASAASESSPEAHLLCTAGAAAAIVADEGNGAGGGGAEPVFAPLPALPVSEVSRRNSSDRGAGATGPPSPGATIIVPPDDEGLGCEATDSAEGPPPHSLPEQLQEAPQLPEEPENLQQPQRQQLQQQQMQSVGSVDGHAEEFAFDYWPSTQSQHTPTMGSLPLPPPPPPPPQQEPPAPYPPPQPRPAAAAP
ncbi:unnamed protein product, partial [Phaeothamnion confervicola]